MGDFFIFLIVVTGLSIPLSLIGTYHARKMAEIARRGTSTESEARLHTEIGELRQLVAQQAIILDDLSSMHRRILERSPDDQAIRNRIGTN